MPSGLWAPSKIVSGVLARRPRTGPGPRVPAAAARDRLVVERAEERLGGGRARARSCAAGRARRRAPARRGSAGADHAACAARSAQTRSATASASGCRSGPTTSVPPGRTTSSFSSAIAVIVEPSQRVCSSATLVRTCDLGADDVGGVVAAAEPGLDDRDLHARRARARRRPRRSAPRTA